MERGNVVEVIDRQHSQDEAVSFMVVFLHQTLAARAAARTADI